MFFKVSLVTLVMAATGLALLGLRDRRLAREHEIAELHQRIDAGRRAVWDAQVRVAGETSPEVLRARLAGLDRAFEAVRAAEAEPPLSPRRLAAAGAGR